MDELFESFIREKRFLTGVSKNTIKWYRTSWAAYKKAVGGEVSKQNLKEFIIILKERGLTPGGVNNYVRGVNVYLTWLFENEHTKEHLKMKKVKEEQIIIETFSDTQLGALISYKPKNFPDTRLHTMLLFAIDTGCRIEEILTLKRQNVNLESLCCKVVGKGAKERVVPISIELRRALFKFLKKHEFELVFCTRHGHPLQYRNMLRDFKLLGEELGFAGVRVSWHTLRHTFAYNYVKNGGNVLYLQRALGHTDLTITKRYVNVQTEDLQLAHLKLSPLSRLKN